jgi:hypothetical protein
MSGDRPDYGALSWWRLHQIKRFTRRKLQVFIPETYVTKKNVSRPWGQSYETGLFAVIETLCINNGKVESSAKHSRLSLLVGRAYKIFIELVSALPILRVLTHAVKVGSVAASFLMPTRKPAFERSRQ